MKKMGKKISDAWSTVSTPLTLEVVPSQKTNSAPFLAIGMELDAGSASTVAYRRVGDWDAVQLHLTDIDNERFVLREAVTNLWQTYRFNQHYIGFLSGGVSEKDFNKASEEYSTALQTFSPDYVRKAVGIIVNTLHNEELTTQDLSVILNVDPNQTQFAFHCEISDGKKKSGGRAS